MDIIKIEEKAKEYFIENEEKYEHSLRVKETAEKLIDIWFEEHDEVYKNNLKKKAIVASLFHDIGKSIKKEDMIEFCKKNGYEKFITDYMINNKPMSAHGIASKILFESECENIFKEEFSEEELRQIKHAIQFHTAGATEMNDLDLIIFIADSIEPQKRHTELLDIIAKEKLSIIDSMIELIRRKIERAKTKSYIYNPELDNVLEGILKNK